MLTKIFLSLTILFVVMYTAAIVVLSTEDEPIATFEGHRAGYRNVSIFGASGTAGDGILKAALADSEIERIQVITRRTTPRIEEGVATGKVQVTLHTDYTDYSAVIELVADSDAVYWAIGTSSIGVDEKTYAEIHVDFPMRFVEEWLLVSRRPYSSFHYLSSSDISEKSSSMWAQQKFRAEQSLFALASGPKLKVIAYRPDYIRPTEEEAHFGQKLLYWFFEPVGGAVRAKQIGQAMIEVSARISKFANGDKLTTSDIIRYSEAYAQQRQ